MGLSGAVVRRCAALVGAVVVVAVVAVPASAELGPTVTYQSSATLPCALAPQVLNIGVSVALTLTAQGPAFAEAGDSFSLTGATGALTQPAAPSESFIELGASYEAGDVSNLPIDASGATPASDNPATSPPYSALNVEEAGGGLPFGPVAVTTDAPLALPFPVTTSPAVDTNAAPTESYDIPTGTLSSFSLGPFAVTAPVGSDVALSIDTAPGFVKAGATYKVNFGQGVDALIEGFADPSLNLDTVEPITAGNPFGENLVAGPLSLPCNAPAGAQVASVPIVAPPTITQEPLMPGLNADGTVTVSSGATGTPAPIVQWQVSTDGGATWTNIAGADSPTYTFTPVPGAVYRAQWSNSISNPEATPSGPFTIGVVNTNPVTPRPSCGTPVITTQPASTTVTAPAAASFSVAASAPAGCAPPTVQWQVSTNGGTTFTSITGATSPTLTISPTTVSDSGNEYRADLTNGSGSTASNAATLTVLPGPTVTRILPNRGGAFTLVFIQGTNLSGATAVHFATKPALFVDLSSTIALALAPAEPAGTVADVTVTTANGTSPTSAGDRFTYRGGPF